MRLAVRACGNFTALAPLKFCQLGAQVYDFAAREGLQRKEISVAAILLEVMIG
jgi:hypothetical protein